MTQNRHITFVGGLHRSGTTFFADYLARHPSLGGHTNQGIGENEGQFTQDVLPPDDKYHGPGRFAYYDDYQNAMDAATHAEAASRLMDAWSQFWPTDANFVIEKTPGNLLRAPLLKGLFPDARFIFLIRHPIAVSLATQKWSHTGIFSLIEHWLTAYERLLVFEKASIEYILIVYEDLLCRPADILQFCYKYIGLPVYNIDEPLGIRDANFRYFSQWTNVFRSSKEYAVEFAVLKQRNETFKAKVLRAILHRAKTMERYINSAGFQITIAQREAADACACFEKRVAAFGYSLVDLSCFPCSYISRAGVGREPIP